MVCVFWMFVCRCYCVLVSCVTLWCCILCRFIYINLFDFFLHIRKHFYYIHIRIRTNWNGMQCTNLKRWWWFFFFGCAFHVHILIKWINTKMNLQMITVIVTEHRIGHYQTKFQLRWMTHDSVECFLLLIFKVNITSHHIRMIATAEKKRERDCEIDCGQVRELLP